MQGKHCFLSVVVALVVAVVIVAVAVVASDWELGTAVSSEQRLLNASKDY